LWQRVAGLFLRRRREQELASEIDNHIAWQTEDYIRAGMSPEEARRASLVKFGGLESIKEEYRDQRGVPQLETLWQDARFAARAFAKRPGFFAVVVLSLAIGIGLNATIFTWLKAVYFNPLPGVVHARQLVTINAAYANFGAGYSNSFADYQFIRGHSRLFQDLFAHEMLTLAVSDGRSAQMAMGGIVSGRYFDILGVKMAAGRAFEPEEDQVLDRNPVIVLGDRIWRVQFGADPNLLGKQILLNRIPFTVIGVAAPGFLGVYGGIRQDFWIPLHMARALDAQHRDTLAHGSWLQIMGRPKNGVGLPAIQAELDVLSRQMRLLQHKDDTGYHAQAFALHQAQRGFHSGIYEMVRIVGAVVVSVLLLACLNAANLLMGRATERSREMSVRISLGAGRGRIVRQLLTESFLIAACAGAAGLLIVFATRSLPAMLTPPGMELYLNLDFDWRVLSFLLSISFATALLFGLWPALETARVNVAESLKEGSGNITAGRRRTFWRGVLVAGQVAFAMTALFGALLFAVYLHNEVHAHRGFESRNVLTTSVDLLAAGFDETRGQAFYADSAERVAALPGIASAAWTTFLPMSGSGGGNSRRGEVRGYLPPDGKPLRIVVDTIGPGYLKTLGIPLLEGREFARSDARNSAPVLIVNQQFVSEYLPRREALGAQVRIGDVWRTIVGVHRNYVYRDPTWSPSPAVLLPMAQDYNAGAILVVRTKAEPAAMAPAVRRQILAFDRTIPIGGFVTMEENVGTRFASDEIGTAALTIFAVFAGTLAAIGIYAVLAAYVQQRRHEFGIRIALGALPGDVRQRVLLESGRLAPIGGGIGLMLSAALGKLIASSVVALRPFDPWLYLAATAAIAAIVALATFAPARNASRMDALAALRTE
jgi:predicted permease